VSAAEQQAKRPLTSRECWRGFNDVSARDAMTFDETYPLAAPRFQTADGFRKGAGAAVECVNCGRNTAWFHKQLCLYFCSPNCFEQYGPESRSDGLSLPPS
jgi:hypothetical protein